MDRLKTVNFVPLMLGSIVTVLMHKTDKMETTLVGFEEHAFLILKFPPVAGVKRFLRDKTPFAANISRGGSNVFFASQIEGTLESRFLALCTYPHSFKVLDGRQWRRVDCLLPAEATFEEKIYPGVVRDISESGCQMVLESGLEGLRSLTEGSTVQVVFGVEKSISLEGKVLRVQRKVGRLTLGLAFQSLKDRDAMLLASYVRNLDVPQR